MAEDGTIHRHSGYPSITHDIRMKLSVQYTVHYHTMVIYTESV